MKMNPKVAAAALPTFFMTNPEQKPLRPPKVTACPRGIKSFTVKFPSSFCASSSSFTCLSLSPFPEAEDVGSPCEVEESGKRMMTPGGKEGEQLARDAHTTTIGDGRGSRAHQNQGSLRDSESAKSGEHYFPESCPPVGCCMGTEEERERNTKKPKEIRQRNLKGNLNTGTGGYRGRDLEY